MQEMWNQEGLALDVSAVHIHTCGWVPVSFHVLIRSTQNPQDIGLGDN